jgi:four helix bundle protein
MQEILDKSFDFSIRAMEMINYLKMENKPFPLSERFLSCATGIGMAVRLMFETGNQPFSDKGRQAFAYLLEVEYLLEVMVKTGYLSEKQSQPMKDDCRRLKALITEQLQGGAAL